MAGASPLEQADLKAAAAVAPVRETRVVRVLGAMSEVADQPPLVALTAATMLVGLALRRPRLAGLGGRMLAAELAATALKSLVKHRVDRTRPHVVMDGGAYALRPGSTHASAYNSFPSGHTAGAVAVARAIARDRPEAAPGVYTAAAAIAAVQVPRCQHYPTDLAAGAGIGFLAEWLTHRAERALRALAG